ncbi:MAG: shikimate kinase [bacterium]
MKTSGKTEKSIIYLTGFMGSGKSTIGPILANTLGFDYIDIDKFIEHETKKRVVDIFASEGEQKFRELERSVLAKISSNHRYVIALGGGTIANEQNYQIIRQTGVIVYLQLSPEHILHRVQHKTDRPMLKSSTGTILPPDEMRERVHEILDHREEFYTRADIVIRTDNKRVGPTVDEIVKNLRGMIKL